MPLLQYMIRALRNSILPRGWAPALMMLGKFMPSLRKYRAKLSNGDFLFVDLTQSMCFGYFFYGELPHEPATQQILKRILAEGSVFIDVGANIGYFTRMASHLVGHSGMVYAFEPLPEAYTLLMDNTQDLSNVKALPFAAADSSGETELYAHRSGDRSSLLAVDPMRVVKVKKVTLDSLLNEVSRVDLVKIDVEGSETMVLKGAKQLFRKCHPIVLFEYLDSPEARSLAQKDDFETFFSSIPEADYTLFKVNNISPETRLLLRHDRAGGYLLAVPSDKNGILRLTW